MNYINETSFTALTDLTNVNCNSINNVDASFYDPTSSIQDQLNSIAGTSIYTLSGTINNIYNTINNLDNTFNDRYLTLSSYIVSNVNQININNDFNFLTLSNYIYSNINTINRNNDFNFLTLSNYVYSNINTINRNNDFNFLTLSNYIYSNINTINRNNDFNFLTLSNYIISSLNPIHNSIVSIRTDVNNARGDITGLDKKLQDAIDGLTAGVLADGTVVIGGTILIYNTYLELFKFAPINLHLGGLDTLTSGHTTGIGQAKQSAADAMTRANSAYDHTVYEINTHYAEDDPLEAFPIKTTVYIEEKLRNTVGTLDGVGDKANNAYDRAYNAQGRCTTLEGKTEHIESDSYTTQFSSNIQLSGNIVAVGNIETLGNVKATGELKGETLNVNGLRTDYRGVIEQTLGFCYLQDTLVESLNTNVIKSPVDMPGVNPNLYEDTIQIGLGSTVITLEGITNATKQLTVQSYRRGTVLYASAENGTFGADGFVSRIGSYYTNNQIFIGNETSTTFIFGKVKFYGDIEFVGNVKINGKTFGVRTEKTGDNSFGVSSTDPVFNQFF